MSHQADRPILQHLDNDLLDAWKGGWHALHTRNHAISDLLEKTAGTPLTWTRATQLAMAIAHDNPQVDATIVQRRDGTYFLHITFLSSLGGQTTPKDGFWKEPT